MKKHLGDVDPGRHIVFEDRVHLVADTERFKKHHETAPPLLQGCCLLVRKRDGKVSLVAPKVPVIVLDQNEYTDGR